MVAAVETRAATDRGNRWSSWTGDDDFIISVGSDRFKAVLASLSSAPNRSIWLPWGPCWYGPAMDRSTRQPAGTSRCGRWCLMLVVAMTTGCTGVRWSNRPDEPKSRSPIVASVVRWRPPPAPPAAGSTIVLGEIIGPSETADAIRTALLADRPTVLDRSIRVVDGRASSSASPRLTSSPVIQLASAETPVETIQYELRGEVLPPVATAIRRDGSPPPPQPIRMTWRLLRSGTESRAARSLGGEAIRIDPPPMSISGHTLGQNTPLPPSVRDAMRQTMVRQAAQRVYGLVAPSIIEETIALAPPRRIRRDQDLRRANAAAAAGDWFTASSTYQRIVDAQPHHHAALHNLAIANVAAQDFMAARQHIDAAMRHRPSPRYRRTMQWIELVYRDHQRSFGLPDPPPPGVTNRQTPGRGRG